MNVLGSTPSVPQNILSVLKRAATCPPENLADFGLPLVLNIAKEKGFKVPAGLERKIRETEEKNFMWQGVEIGDSALLDAVEKVWGGKEHPSTSALMAPPPPPRPHHEVQGTNPGEGGMLKGTINRKGIVVEEKRRFAKNPPRPRAMKAKRTAAYLEAVRQEEEAASPRRRSTSAASAGTAPEPQPQLGAECPKPPPSKARRCLTLGKKNRKGLDVLRDAAEAAGLLSPDNGCTPLAPSPYSPISPFNDTITIPDL